MYNETHPHYFNIVVSQEKKIDHQDGLFKPKFQQ